MWRMLNNILSVKTKLLEKGIAITKECTRFRREEMILHVFLDYDKAKSFWKKLGRNLHIQAPLVVTEWVEQEAKTRPKEEVEEIFFYLWRLWTERNEAIWNKKIFTD